MNNQSTAVCILGSIPMLISVNDVYIGLMIVVLIISIITSIVGLITKFKETKTIDSTEVTKLQNQVDELLETFDKLNKDNGKKD